MPEVVDARVTARIARQAILSHEDPPLTWTVIDEAVLYRQIGTAEVMRAQLARLAGIAAFPRVTVQVIPRVGAHPGLMGAVTIAEADGIPVALNTEDAVDGRTSEDAGLITEAMTRFRYCQSLAWPADASRTMITKAEETWR
jgi:hypothetical protein